MLSEDNIEDKIESMLSEDNTEDCYLKITLKIHSTHELIHMTHELIHWITFPV